MLVVPTGRMTGPKYVINFPTKRHWKGKSRLEDVDAGLVALVAEVERLGVRSIAIPPLGCGLGGLDWRVIEPRIRAAFAPLPDVRVMLFPPAGAPPARDMPVNTKPANMTHARALLVKLMDRYAEGTYRLTLLEVQKLAYFLQEEGEPLKLRFEAGHYGPYADNLNKVLQATEGHFTRGYGDTPKPDQDIDLLPGAVAAADAAIDSASESARRLARVTELIDGFETPYGMELLSSVHWVAHHAKPAATTADEAVATVHGWNDRKRTTLRADHIRIAWDHLSQFRSAT
jgi:O-acetyl-ADP-ribose deacetylase (regulator of RNase III)